MVLKYGKAEAGMLAYIDPGSGMILIQAVIAAILGIVIFFRDKAKMFFRIIFGRKTKPHVEESDADTNATKGE